MSILIKTLIRLGLLKDDLDYHIIRASMVIICLLAASIYLLKQDVLRVVSAAPANILTGASTTAQVRA